ncbi:MAG: RsmE family RNA methyltransferase [Candidatus Tyrphobacter sp.]
MTAKAAPSSARFFVEGAHACGERVRIDGGDAHHIRRVLRLKAGDAVEIVDSASHAFCALIAYDGTDVVAELVQQREAQPKRALRVDVAQALPKASKMEYVIEKTTELGASALFPFTSERTIAAPPSVQRLSRWRRIAQSAAAQCGRRDVPAVLETLSYDALLRRFCAYDLVLFAWESAGAEPLRATLAPLLQGVDHVLVVVGPEGGFTHGEADAACAAGARVVSLGRRVLRTETAALVVLAIVSYETDA